MLVLLYSQELSGAPLATSKRCLKVDIPYSFYPCTSSTTVDGCVLQEPHPMEGTDRIKFILKGSTPQRDPKLEQEKSVRKEQEFDELITTPRSPCTAGSGRGKELEESEVE
ncbi:hypothetical protein HGM15179_007963 [Zosterops borbonicus]|uniref:Uncharacterized protein n=1 Tax=Zosterops borbonicus TaxID=364589 RepID=A0A8K1GHS2_9PASS|nr:hypothetical protein HGM15179_007963 [Zosterops borbonicus]